jgi:hypothetical protein
MVDGHLFNTIAAIADQLRRKTDKPFGGIQAIYPDNSPTISYSDAPVLFSWLLQAIFSNFRQ